MKTRLLLFFLFAFGLTRLFVAPVENFNEQFTGIFSAHEQVPTKGLVATKRFAL